MNTESIALLKECNSGCKSATNSMEQIIPDIKDEKLRKMVEDYNKKHIKLGDECHVVLKDNGMMEQDPNKISKAMAKVSIEFKLAIDSTTDKIADMLVDGCTMGIKSLSKYINQNKGAESKVKDLAFELISIEQDFMNELLAYL